MFGISISRNQKSRRRLIVFYAPFRAVVYAAIIINRPSLSVCEWKRFLVLTFDVYHHPARTIINNRAVSTRKCQFSSAIIVQNITSEDQSVFSEVFSKVFKVPNRIRSRETWTGSLTLPAWTHSDIRPVVSAECGEGRQFSRNAHSARLPPKFRCSS